MSTCSVFSVGQCSKDSYPRKMTACINKCLLKFILLENCFSSLPSGLIERKQRLRKRKWSNKQSQNFSFSGWLQSLKFIRDSSRTGIPKPEPRRICYVTRWSPDVVQNGKLFSPFTLLTEDQTQGKEALQKRPLSVCLLVHGFPEWGSPGFSLLVGNVSLHGED